MNILRNSLLAALIAITSAGNTRAAEPNNYYSRCENLGGAQLLATLCQVVGPHDALSYDGLWDAYNTTDTKTNGKIWDMYSTKEWTPGTNKCGNYSKVGDCYNREHSMPKSWFNDARPMYTDVFHIYPTDGMVNGQRSNFPYGECANGTTLASSGSVKALGKLGNSTFAGYSGKVFEPDDEFKGDFARTYFYMAAAYNDRVASWTYAESKPMLAGNSYPAFNDWAIELLLKWHRQDPVSDKERARQEAAYALQHNRNPFIDHPEMAEYIWGDKKTEKWSSAVASQPVLSTPAEGSTINIGTVAVGVSRSFTVNVKGSSLKNALTVGLTQTGNAFTVSPMTLSPDAVNSSNGATLTITVNAPADGTYTATLILNGTADKINRQTTVTANALSGLPAAPPTMITDESFLARWTYIGDADSNGCYTLYVLDEQGNDIDTYPRSVPAQDEQYLVDELQPETDYQFYITNQSLKSNIMTVRTAEPIPNIQILYDGELSLETEPGVPSQAAELLLDIENIFTDITMTVGAPFQISTDNSNWDTTITVDPREDRMYIRIFGDTEGTYTTSIYAVAGDYSNDNAEVTGRIGFSTQFFEDFETEGKQTGNYTTTAYTGNACKWYFSNAGTYEVKDEAYSGKIYLRFGKNKDSYAQMDEDKEHGIGTLTLYAAGWSSSDGASRFKVQYSTDGGQNWQDSGSEIEIPAPQSTAKTYKPYTFAINQTGNVRIRIQQTYGQRMCFDDISATNYTLGVDSPTFGDDRGNGWDAYCLDGILNVILDENADIAIHGTDGITYYNGTANAGINTYPLNPGLYIVVVGQSTRRVLLK